MTEGRKDGEGERGTGWGMLEERRSFYARRGGKRKKKKVLARLKKLGRPLKTIRLMKYVKAHKETLGPFKGVRRGGGGQEAWKTHRVSIFRRERETE